MRGGVLFAIVASLLVGCAASPADWTLEPEKLAVFAPPVEIQGSPGPLPPPPPPPEEIHALVLEAPGATGRITLRRAVRHIPERDPTVREWLRRRNDPPYWTRREYLAEGQITVVDDVGAWGFAYVRLDLPGEDLPAAVDGRWPGWDRRLNVHGLQVVFENRSPGTIQIDWERSRLLDPGGARRALLHRGVKLASYGLSRPTIVPSATALRDFVFPADLVYLHVVNPRRRRSLVLWLATSFFEKARPGSTIGLQLVVVTGGDATEKTFQFCVVPPT